MLVKSSVLVLLALPFFGCDEHKKPELDLGLVDQGFDAASDAHLEDAAADQGPQDLDARPDAALDAGLDALPDSTLGDGPLADVAVDAQPSDASDAETPDVALPEGCGDGIRTPGETCDDGNLNPEGLCQRCQLAGKHELEPNGTFETATPFGPSLNHSLGDLQAITFFSTTDDLDWLGVHLSGPTVLRLVTRDGFLSCPGPMSALVQDTAGQVVAETPLACAEWQTPVLPAGDYGVRLATSARGAVGISLVTFVALTRVASVGEACVGEGVRCQDDTYCEAGVCIENLCGDGRTSPTEACDDGNLDDGDGCDGGCRLELEPLPLDGVINGALSVDEVARYGFHLDQPSRVSAAFQTPCPEDLALGLFRSDGRRMASADTPPCPHLEVDLAGGDYYLAISQLAGQATPDYRLIVNRLPLGIEGDACGDEEPCQSWLYCNASGRCSAHTCGDGVLGPGEGCDDGNDESGDGCSLTCEREVLDVSAGGDFPAHTEAGEIAVFSLTLGSPATVQLWTSDGAQSCPADTVLAVYRETEDGLLLVGENDDDSARAPCSALTLSLLPGVHRVEVFGVLGAAIGDFTLSVAMEESR